MIELQHQYSNELELVHEQLPNQFLSVSLAILERYISSSANEIPSTEALIPTNRSLLGDITILAPFEMACGAIMAQFIWISDFCWEAIDELPQLSGGCLWLDILRIFY